MLYTQFDLQVARYPSLQTVNHQELVNVDLVQIDECIPGGIFHSSQLNWKGDLTFFDSPEAFIRSEKERSELPKSRQYFLDQGYTFQTTQIIENQYQAFLEVYKATTLHRNRAIDTEAELNIKKNLAANVPVWLFGLYKDSQLVSGLLVSNVKDEFRVMFGAKKRFDEVRGGVGGVLEMELLTFCFEKNIRKISHGLSTNPAGIVDKAGVFEFKSRYGFTAFPIGEWKTTFILSTKVAQSDLVFLKGRQDGLEHMILTNSDQPAGKKYQTRFVDMYQELSLESYIERSRQLLSLV